MANTQQYLVEYVVNANVSAAQQSLAALTAQMEQCGSNEGFGNIT